MKLSKWSATAGSRLWKVYIVTCVQILLTQPVLAQDAPTYREELQESIATLRRSGAYAEATKVAAELLGRSRQDPAAKPYEIATFEQLVETLRKAASLPAEEQQELRRAEILDFGISSDNESGTLAQDIEMIQEQVEIRKRLLGTNNFEVATSLNNLAELLRARGDYAQAEPLYREALAIVRVLLGEKHPSGAMYLNNLAILLHDLGDNAKAEALFREALAIRRELLGAEHVDVATSLNCLGAALEARRDYAGAEPLYREALAMRQNLLGAEHPSVATCLNNLAGLLQARGDYAGADSLYRETLRIDRKLLGADHPNIAMDLNNLAGLLRDRGDYAAAEPLYRESLAMLRKIWGDEGHPDVALSLNNLAQILQYQGNYAGAEPLFRQALAMRRTILGEVHPDIAVSLNNLGALFYVRGDYSEAETLYREALAMNRELSGEAHPDIALSLNNLANLFQARGDYAGAEPLFREALSMRRNLLGAEHRLVAQSLSNLAVVLRARGDYAGAAPLFHEALSMRRKLLGTAHPDIAISLNNLAMLLQDRGDYATAESMYREALAMRRELLGDEHPYVFQSLNYLAGLHLARGDYIGAEPVFDQAAAVFESARGRAGAGLAKATFAVSPYPSMAALRLLAGRTEAAWPACERSLGRVLAGLLQAAAARPLTVAETAREDSLRQMLGDAERRLLAYRREAQRDTTETASQRVVTARNHLLEQEARWSLFQAAIARAHPTAAGQAYPLERVQVALGRNTALLGWLDVEIRPDTLVSWAYVIRPNRPVQWFRLDTESAAATVADLMPAVLDTKGRSMLPRLAAAWSSALVDLDAPAPHSARIAAAFSAARIQPALSLLDGIEDLIVIPSGVMAAIPVESLIDDKGRLLGDRFSISYAPSATIFTWLRERAIERRRSEPAPKIDAEQTLLLGDPCFALAQKTAMAQEQALPLALAAVSNDAATLRDARAGSVEALARLPRLPATRAEVNAIAAIAPSATVLLGPDASEQQLTRLALSGELAACRTVHLATHAFADPEQPERSCLILSQVDLPDALEAAEEGRRIYDGRLTVQEILQEWKLDADLVTLSACETALGRQISGEGLVGFAHAFLQAGARNLLVSLWKVDDRATSLLMTRFYGNLWQRQMGKAAALREAKKWLRGYEEDPGHRPYDHPYFWSAFILIGDRG